MVGRAVDIAVRSSALTKVQTRIAVKESQNAEPLRKPVLAGGESAVASEPPVGVGLKVVPGCAELDIVKSSRRRSGGVIEGGETVHSKGAF